MRMFLKLKTHVKSFYRLKHVLFETQNKNCLITLNRPEALNALNLSMIEDISNHLKKNDNNSIVITGNTKAFCAGGDVVSLFNAKEDDSNKLAREFFSNEYRLDYLTSNLIVPYISLIEGVYMGGGVGISVHGPYRVVTENTTFAMPETSIGFIPDVGGSHFLSRLKNGLGMFLGLTGARLKGSSIYHAGIATHFVKSEK
ncbi:Trans-2-decenoyl-[acyl-carrier-protein] isomerase, partial [Intoshia linei]